jgi:hypothetical protein
MTECESDILKFNDKVDVLVESLEARNAPVPNIMTGLFRAYQGCGDAPFAEYMTRKRDDYLDGKYSPTRPELMRVALERFKVSTTNGEWLKQTDEQLKFIALQAKLDKLTQNTPKKGDAKKKSDGSKKKTDKANKFAWKAIAPKEGEPQEKTFNGKEYIYCPHHGDTKWVLKVNHKGIDHRTGCTKKNTAKDKGEEQGFSAQINNDDEDDEDLKMEADN